MAVICDSCFTTDTGFLEEGSYDFDLGVATPDRIYCVNGVPVAPPSRGAMAPLAGRWAASPTGARGPIGTVTMAAQEEANVSWTNLTGRPVSLFAILNGYTSGKNGAVVMYATAVLSANGVVILRAPVHYYATAIALPIFGISDTVAVAAGASVTFSVAVSYTIASGPPSTASIDNLDISYVVMGGTSYE